MQLALAAPGKAKAGTVEVSDAAFGSFETSPKQTPSGTYIHETPSESGVNVKL